MTFKEIIVLSDCCGPKSIGLNDIDPGSKIFLMNLKNDFRFREKEELIISLKILSLPILETLAAKVFLFQLILLNHRPHRSIDVGNAFLKDFFEWMDRLS